MIKEENGDLMAPLCIASNKCDELIKYYMQQNFMEKAHILSVAASEGLLSSTFLSSENKIEEKNVPEDVYNE